MFAQSTFYDKSCVFISKLKTKKIVEVPSSTKYTLTRGNLATFDINDLIQLQVLLKKSDLKKLHGKIQSTRIGGDFNGGSSVTFRTNADITVTRLAFWGPVSGNDADFDVFVNFSQGCGPGQFPQSPNAEVQIARFTSKVKASPNEKFYVDFPDGVPTLKGFWNKIGFMLKGPQTRVCAGTKNFEKCPESQVEFEFYSSSNQMPEIQYRLT